MTFATPIPDVRERLIHSDQTSPTPKPRIEMVRTVETITHEPQYGEMRKDEYGIPMVYVPAGRFRMGNDHSIYSDDKPSHEVDFAQGYWIDQFPVTNEMYEVFVRSKDYHDPTLWTERGLSELKQLKKTGPHDYSGFMHPRQPRVGITWYEALAYSRWRCARLPTEAEWEYAARGPQSPLYPWGDEWNPECVIWGGNSDGKTAEVGSKPQGKSWVNAYDMVGNVWEWCSSTLQPYPFSNNDGREGRDSAFHVVRGGSWYDRDTNTINTSYRQSARPPALLGFQYVGFRCVHDFEW